MYAILVLSCTNKYHHLLQYLVVINYTKSFCISKSNITFYYHVTTNCCIFNIS